MASIKGIIVEIGGDTSGLQKALSKVNSSTASLSKELKGINSLLKLDPKNTQLLSQKQTVLKKNIEDTSKKLEHLKEAQERYVESGGDLNSEKYRNLQREIINTENKLKQLKLEQSKWTTMGRKIEEFGNKVKGVSDKISKLGTTLTTKLTLPIAGIATGMVKSAKDFETAFTGVEKTVDGTEEQMKNLREGIKKMAEELPSSTTEISAVAEAAGQLGIETDNILGFSKAMIDLGNSTNLSSEEASSQLAKFANITQMSQKDFDKLGSSIVDLGNNFATTEADIVNMSMRLAGAGKQVGLSQGDILGLATALSSVGVEAEMGGSAFSKAMVKMQSAVEVGGTQLDEVLKKSGKSLRDLQLMSDNDTKSFKELADGLGMTKTELKNMVTAGAQLQDFAKISGMSTEQFKKQWKKDAVGAINAFIKGLGNTKKQGKSAIALLQDMGLSEVRLRDSLLRAANSGDLFSRAVSKGNKAFKENTALSKEANKRYQTLDSRLEMTKNKLINVATNTGEKLTPTFNVLLGKVDGLIDKFGGLNEEETKNVLKTAAIVAAIGPALKILGALGSGIGSTIKGVGTLSQAIGVLKTGAESANTSANTLAAGLKFMSNPYVLAAGAIVTATAVIIHQIKKAEEQTKKTFENMGNSASSYVSGIDNAKSHLSEFNRTMFVSSEEQQKLEKQMQEVQKGITTICQTASKERRDYTQKEIQQLDDYFKKLRELNQRELEIEKSIATAISQQAQTTAENFQGSLEEYKIQSQEWIKTAEEQKNKEIELINSQTTEEIALLNQRYGTKATMENEAYKNEYTRLISNKDNKIKEVNSEIGRILNLYTKGYAERANVDGAFYEHIKHYNGEIEKEEERHNYSLEQTEKSRILDNSNKVQSMINENQRHEREQKKIWKDMYKNMSDSEAEQLGSWLAMVSQTELYGGKIDKETQSMVNSIMASYDSMPKKTREAMKNAMTPMLTEMQKKEPSLFAKATNIANGIISRLKKSFDINSPSRKTRKIFQNVMLGAEEGLESERKTLYSQVDNISNGIIDEMKKELEINSPSKKAKNQIGKNIALGVIEGVGSQKKNAKKSAEKLASLYVSAAKEKMTSLKNANKISEAQEVEYWNTIVKHVKKGTKAYNTALNQLNKSKKKLKNDVASATKRYIKDVSDVQSDLNKSITELKKNYNDSVNNRKEEIVNSLNLFDAVELNEGISKQQLTKNLKTQVNALKEWNNVLKSLESKISNKDLLEDLESQGVGSLNTLKALNSMSKKELDEYVKLYSSKNSIALNRARTENKDLLKDTNDQIAKLKENATKKMASLKVTYEKELRKLGVTSKIKSEEIGKQITSGISSGMSAGMTNLSKKMKSQVKKLVKEVKKELKIKSPSRVFKDEIGRYMALGIGVGFEDSISEAYKQMRTSMNSETKKLENNINNIPINDFGKLQGKISSQVAKASKTIFTTPQININAKELTQENLQQILNFVNRKFGSAY